MPEPLTFAFTLRALEIHLTFATLVALAAWAVTLPRRVSATTKYWIWVATSINFVLPIGVPALASLAIFQFIWVWNDLLVALVFLGSSTHITLTMFLYGQTRALANNYYIISTGAMISIIIPLIVFFAFQRYFVRGVLAGAVK